MGALMKSTNTVGNQTIETNGKYQNVLISGMFLKLDAMFLQKDFSAIEYK